MDAKGLFTQPTNADDTNFQAEVLNSDKPVIVDFWAAWCGPCRMLGPVLEQVAAQHTEVKVVKINVDESPETARAYGITSIPMLMRFDDGEVTKTLLGARPKREIERELLPS